MLEPPFPRQRRPHVRGEAGLRGGLFGGRRRRRRGSGEGGGDGEGGGGSEGGGGWVDSDRRAIEDLFRIAPPIPFEFDPNLRRGR